MPEALATTKRKFYKALDSLTSTASSSPLHDTASASTSKRSSSAAFDEARERVRKRLRVRPSTSSTSLSSIDRTSSVIRVPHKSVPRDPHAPAPPPPNYSPWSQETFLARLKTFSSVRKWHPKPEAINEMEWAKRGWQCVDVNTVSCKGGCGRRVVVAVNSPAGQMEEETENDENGNKDDDDQSAELERALVERYQVEIVEGHASSCLWRKGRCKDDIYRLPVVRPSVWQPELCQRIESLRKIKGAIQNLKTRPPGPSSDSLRLTMALPREIVGLTNDNEPDTSIAKAFEIAMYGWHGSSEAGNQLLQCNACFQRIGLWMYQPDYKNSTSHSNPAAVSSDGGSGDTATDEGDPAATVDLLEMHRDHCPWQNVQTQHATGSLSGLNATEILRRVVATAARDHRRRSEQHASTSTSTPQVEAEADAGEPEDESSSTTGASPKISREEITRQDKERESRLHKLKSLFNLKRRPTTKVPLLSSSVQKTA